MENESDARLLPVSHRRIEFASKNFLKSCFKGPCAHCTTTPLQLGSICLGDTVLKNGAASSDPAVIVELDKSAGMAQLCYVDYEWRHKLQTDRGADGSSSWRALVGKDDEYLSKCGMPLEVAQYYVGVMHALGTHVKARDMGAAKALWVRAAKRGFLPAQKSLQVVPLALVRPLCAFHAPPIGRGMSAVLPERPPLWWRVLPSTYEAMQADARDQERLEKLSKKQKNKQEQGPSQKRPRIDARGAPWFNALFPRDEILNSVGGNAISCAAGAPDAVSRAHAAVEAVVSGFAVAMRDMAKRSAADNSSSGGGDSSISSSSNNGGNNGNGNGNGGDSSNDRILKPLLTTITNLDGAIDALPGLDRTPEQQLERLAALSEELKAEQKILSDAVREAEGQLEINFVRGEEILTAITQGNWE